MTIDEIRKFKKHEPFEPFEIVLVDVRDQFAPAFRKWAEAPPQGGVMLMC